MARKFEITFTVEVEDDHKFGVDVEAHVEQLATDAWDSLSPSKRKSISDSYGFSAVEIT